MRLRLSQVSVFLAIMLLVAWASASSAQSPKDPRPGPPAVQVMVLGVFHFANPNADYAKFQGMDVLTATRQKEIEAVVHQLARFRPTKIALEREPGEADSINADYRRYLTGGFTLTRNEIHQLGFRLAARMHHTQLYAVDFPLALPIDSVLAYAQHHDTAFVVRFQSTIANVVRVLDRMQQEEPSRPTSAS